MQDGIEVDCCRKCGGTWLDRGELTTLVEMGRPRKAAEHRPPPSPSEGDAGPLSPEFLEGLRRRQKGRGRRSALDDSRQERARDPLTENLYRVWKFLERLL